VQTSIGVDGDNFNFFFWGGLSPPLKITNLPYDKLRAVKYRNNLLVIIRTSETENGDLVKG